MAGMPYNYISTILNKKAFFLEERRL